MKKFFPVIHCKDIEQAYRNIHIAQQSGADGAFLINHKIPHFFLTCIAEKAISDFPTFPIGLNYLDLLPMVALSALPDGATALWTDNPCIIENGEYDQPDAQMFLDYREAKESPVCYYGSVAFKYQPPVRDLDLMTATAVRYMDVITTSGPATGKAADIEKIKKMKSLIGDKSLALASGVDNKNVRTYLPYVDDFLVATSISIDFFNLNEKKTKELSKIIHDYNQ